MYEICQQHLPGGVQLEPGFDAARLGVIFCAKLLGVDRLPSTPAGRLAQRSLPSFAGHLVQLRVQPASAQRGPLAAVEPEAVAVAALVEREAKIERDAIA